ncbi:receptor-mediated endocytosis protein 6 homolog isoform X3 [Topomyia yanbarensis]|uniref:receptor-mediated endocytosis protein 6 homolog isoform X3 n=1 Tax=Topomyia yanbarensis TaxID=2498891 RepID=UPI00273CA2FB|nr:receptor-mediated endocytosis protein 6 homolog isoform X3 [Topomyia yanbarensis]
MESKGVESFWAVVNLARTLRREYMFIANEQTNVLNLHETYERNMCKTLQIAWICANRRQIINNLITANPEFGPSLSCQQTNKLENVQFLDVRQSNTIKYLDTSNITDFIVFLHDSPHILAHCISIAESRDTPVSQIDIVIGFIVNGLYGSAIHSRDAKMIIKLLQVLIETQIVVSDNPRRLLCAGSSAFTRLFQRMLYEHIGQLGKSITPSHTHLRISTAYTNEAPWLFAQVQLSFMSAYKTPHDKVACVVKCIKSLLSFLSMGSDRSVAADDIIPVLIYVIIQTNPTNLLSTIEYVNCFFGDKLSGENHYWWTQFCSAVTFIKTMDY